MTALVTTHQALLRAICTHPADDLPRCAFADFLEETGDRGDAIEAAFIRRQFDGSTPYCIPLSLLMKAEYAIGALAHQCNRFGQSDRAWAERDGRKLEWRRGFVAEVTLPLAAFLGSPCPRCGGDGTLHNDMHHSPDECRACGGTGRVEGLAKRLFESHPITAVTFGDREPERIGLTPLFAWRNTTRADIGPNLPHELFERLIGETRGLNWAGYPTRALALRALSSAAVALGRAAAGLPPLSAGT